MSDNYPIPLAGASAPHTASLLIKRSRFLTQIARTGTPEEARAFIERIRSLNTDATHNCWAFVAGPPGSTARIGCNDDGEPHGTAGRPMLQILLHSGVGQICAVVTRWFGGIKLGTGGLVRAYQDSVSNCLASLPTEILIPSVTLSLRMGYGDRDSALRLLRQCGGSVLSEDFSENVRLSVRVPESSAEAFRAGLFTAGGGKVVVEEETVLSSVPACLLLY